jgi:hypothetical protein
VFSLPFSLPFSVINTHTPPLVVLVGLDTFTTGIWAAFTGKTRMLIIDHDHHANLAISNQSIAENGDSGRRGARDTRDTGRGEAKTHARSATRATTPSVVAELVAKEYESMTETLILRLPQHSSLWLQVSLFHSLSLSLSPSLVCVLTPCSRSVLCIRVRMTFCTCDPMRCCGQEVV